MKNMGKFYQQMYLIRTFENALDDLSKKGLLFGTIHSCAGQEAVAVGLINALGSEDVITGNHRSHGHYLAYADDVDGLLAEIMGREAGIVGGRGGTQHIYKRNFYSNGVLGSTIPLATGMALAEKLKKTGNIVVCFIGDGALGQGVLYESLNMASLWSLPIIYTVENNLYAMSTCVKDAAAGNIAERARAFGIECREESTHDVEEIFKATKEMAGQVRRKSRPLYWMFNTYRLQGHSKSDTRTYRSCDEEAMWAQKDPLLIGGAGISNTERQAIEKDCRKRIDDAVERVMKMPFPSLDRSRDKTRNTSPAYAPGAGTEY